MSTNQKRLIVNGVIFLVTIGFFAIAHKYLRYDDIFKDVSAWGTFYTVFGVLYAIIAGFLIIEALSKYNKLQEIIEEEINNLQDIRDLAIYLGCSQSIIKKIVFELKGYARSVATVEWEVMKRGLKTLNADTTREMYEIFQVLNQIEVKNNKDEITLRLFIQKITEITTLRTKRISTSTQKLPYSLKILLYFMSWSLIVGLILMGVHNIVIHFIMVFSLVVSVQLLNSIILDIDDPFDGLWKIKPTLFNEFLQSIDESKDTIEN